MAGLEVAFACFRGGITTPQDAVVCLLHTELIRRGFRCVGGGEQPRGDDKPSELLPSDWSSSKEVYTLRYQGNGGTPVLLVKAVTDDTSPATLLFNLVSTSTQEVMDLTVNLVEHVDAEQLQVFDRVFRDEADLVRQVHARLLSFPGGAAEPRAAEERRSRREEEEVEEERRRRRREDRDPLRLPPRHPNMQAHWNDPMVPPFSVGGADLDPFGSHGGGGMILDPLRSGFPRSGFDPSSGIPGILPPGAVPPGARFDPFGPVGRPGPDPDHLPPPGYDDMFM